jgi:CBS domain containing-hemolysin-like protein
MTPLIAAAALFSTQAWGADSGAGVSPGIGEGERSAAFLLPLFALLLVMSGFVSGTETAIFSLDRLDVLQLKGHPSGLRWALVYLLDRPNDTLTTILILNNVVNVAISLVGGAVAESYFHTFSPLALMLAAFGITSLILVFGEVVPKCVAQVSAHAVAPYVAWPTFAVAVVLRPVRRIMNGFIDWAFDLFNVPRAREAELVSEEELKVMLSAGRVSNLLEDEERDMILGVFELDDTYAEQIMIPRNEVLAFPDSLDQEEILSRLKGVPHSRILIYQQDLDHILGFILAKEVLLNPNQDWHACIREIICIPERMRLDDLLKRFRRSSTKIAAVVDEYGQLAGIVTIRDLLEEIVGDMAERHEKVAAEVKALKDGRYRVQGRTKLANLARRLAIEFPPDIGATAGGFMMNMLGHVPEEGAEVTYGGYRFRVDRMVGRKVSVLEIAPVEAETTAAGRTGEGRES